ncbi:MAG TPA: S53 family peptidase [Candidatus Sulfotelmatobacter sp.]|nr:S53 family peptidase [Candidatus Sulfotelmatobacter sp.]
MGEFSRQTVPGSERTVPSGAGDRGPADPNDVAEISVLLRPRETPPEPRPGRAPFDRYEYARRFGATREDVEAVERFARDAGLRVVSHDLARRTVRLSGTVGALGAAFGTELRSYDHGGGSFRGRSGALSVPAELGDIVVGVFGLDERPQARAQFRPAAAAATAYDPMQIADLYGFPAGTTGAGQTIALVELGGGYQTSDLQTYFGALGVSVPSVTAVSVDGATNAPTGQVDGPDGEVMLDIEVAGSVAPDAAIAVYFAPNTDQGFLDAITTAVHATTPAVDVISISWGGAESTWTAQAMTQFDQAFTDAGNLGITVCVAAGDGGSSDGVTDGKAHVDFPASSPHALACGGTTLQGSGSVIASEVVWNDGAQGGATGGGVSDQFSLPSWQTTAGVPPSVNDGHVGRGVPDVAGDADPNTGYSVRIDGTDTVFGGTSAVAPLWAALIARLNQSAKQPLGFVNPALYAQGETPFHDVTSGNNGAYSAGPGWDACTGLGSPNGTKLLAAIG